MNLLHVFDVWLPCFSSILITHFISTCFRLKYILKTKKSTFSYSPPPFNFFVHCSYHFHTQNFFTSSLFKRFTSQLRVSPSSIVQLVFYLENLQYFLWDRFGIAVLVLFFPEKFFLSPSILNDSLARQSIFSSRFFPFRTLNIPCMSFLACNVPVEKSAYSLRGVPLKLTFSLVACNCCYFSYVWFIVLRNLYGSCTWISVSFIRLGNFKP